MRSNTSLERSRMHKVPSPSSSARRAQLNRWAGEAPFLQGMRTKAMNMSNRLVVGLCGSLFIAIAAAEPPPTVENATKELVALQHQWAAARVARNVEFLEKLYAREFRITAMNGSIVSRADDIGVFASGDLRPESVTNEDMEVLIYDNVAVVTGLEKVRGTFKGALGNFALRFTNVFVHRDGRWQLVRHQSTELRSR